MSENGLVYTQNRMIGFWQSSSKYHKLLPGDIKIQEIISCPYHCLRMAGNTEELVTI